MKNIIAAFIFVFSSFNFIAFSQDCKYISKFGNDKPKGYYLGNYPSPFGPTSYIDFGLPDTSRISVSVKDIYGITVYKSDCRLAGGNYKFDYYFLVIDSSGTYFLNLKADFDRTFKIAEMHFEGTRKFIIVK